MEQLKTSNCKENSNIVVQFGEGNFLRAFVEWMIQKSNDSLNLDTGVYIIQPRDNDKVYRLAKQDFNYHVNIKGYKDGKPVDEITEIDCVIGGLNTHKEYDKFLKLAHDTRVKVIVSNTTEAGIIYDENDDDYTLSPITYPGKLTSFLKERFESLGDTNESELLVLPCELIEKNGEVLKNTILQYVKLWNLGEDFVNWLDKRVLFINTLVDRIVPGFPDDKDEIIRRIGKEDDFFVEAEPFHLWVVEDNRIENILKLKEAGLNVIYTDDLTPYRDMKVRILNGAHTIMVPVSILLGIETVSEVLQNQTTNKYINEVIYDEIVPVVDLDKDVVKDYADDVIERFKNPYIRHELMDISLNSISKFRVRVLPTLVDYMDKNNALADGITTSLSALIVFYSGLYNGRTIDLKDEIEVITKFRDLWDDYKSESIDLNTLVNSVLSDDDLWGLDLTEIAGLSNIIEEKIEIILNDGIETLL